MAEEFCGDRETTPEERRRDAEALAEEVRRLLAQKRGTDIDPNATDIE